jgi:type I restriction enzyme R subunit
MSSGAMTEGMVEEAALDYFRSLGYHTLSGPILALEGTSPERSSYEQVILTGRLQDAIERINPDASPAVVNGAILHLQRAESQNLLAENERMHRLITALR